MQSDSQRNLDVRGRTEQIIRELYVKLTQIILQSRVPTVVQQSKNNNNGKIKINKWFNLELEELENITQELTPWAQNMYLPLYIRIFFNSKKSSQQHEERVLLEKWKIQFEPYTGSSRESVEVPTLYKKLVLLVRSLYSFLRVVPAYRVFRDCNRNKMMSGKMFYKIDRFPDDIPGSNRFGLTNNNESGPPTGFSEFKFDTINTVLGKLNVVAHSSETCSFKQLVASSGEMIISSGMLITDYQPSSSDSNDQKIQIQLLQQQLLQTQNMVLQHQERMEKLSTTPPSAHQIQQYLAMHQQSFNSNNQNGSFPHSFGNSSLASQHSNSSHSTSSPPRSFGTGMNVHVGFSPSSLPSQPISHHFASTPIGIPHTFSPPSSMMTTNNSLDPNRSSVSPHAFHMQHFSPPFSSQGFNISQPQNLQGLSTTPPLAPLTMSTSVPTSFGRNTVRPPAARQPSSDFGVLAPSQNRFNNNIQLPFYSLSDIPLDPSQFSSGSEAGESVKYWHWKNFRAKIVVRNPYFWQVYNHLESNKITQTELVILRTKSKILPF
eukprot:TRINITY_DN5898_c0_g1_i1.p1 TRINITY_DN5898_c0_g1~~TRINITY_DN5898_c0_g1_i1.p1  ORF type:complete len:547 (+),score=97.14 TRINITY_DN5898_c0_g1_i1:123-1763(+)